MSKGEREHGSILLVSSRSLSTLAVVALMILLGLIIAICIAEYDQKLQLSGTITESQGLVRVYPSHPGVVVGLSRKEGDEIRAGEVLAEVSSELTNGMGTTPAADAIENLEEQQRRLAFEKREMISEANVEARTAQRHLTSLRARLLTARREVDVNQLICQAAEDNFKRDTQLHDLHLLSDRALEEADQAYLGQKRSLLDAQNSLELLQQEETEASETADKVNRVAMSGASSLDRQSASLAAQVVSQRASQLFRVSSPSSGTLLSYPALQGQSVSESTAIAILRPKGSNLEVVLFVDSITVSHLAVGQKVALTYPGFPYQVSDETRSHIALISATSLTPQELLHRSGVQVAAARYEVIVPLPSEFIHADGSTYHLQSGAPVTAQVFIGRKHLWSNLFVQSPSNGR